MDIKKCYLDGIYIISPRKYSDERGLFFESFNQLKFEKNNIKETFLQDNFSRSTKNVLRGLHFCKKNPQSQLLTVLKGKIFDVVVDIRRKSKTFGKWFSIELSDESTPQIFMKKGFAHGFYVLSDYADLHYKVSQIYNKDDDNGIIWNDKDLNINWPCKDPIISEKDSSLSNFEDLIFK